MLLTGSNPKRSNLELATRMKIPFFTLSRYLQDFGSDLERELKEVLYSGNYAAGKKVAEFEEKWADYNSSNGNKVYCATVANGTVALELVLKYFGKYNTYLSRCYTSTNSFIATSEAIINSGRKPFFVDTDNTGNLDPTKIKSLCNYDVLLPISLYGNPVDFRKFDSTNSIIKILDNCQGHSSLIDGIKPEELCDAVCYSHYTTKLLFSLGEGGSICSKDKDLIDWCKQYSHHGQKEKNKSEFIGSNYRMSEFEATTLLFNLKYLDEAVARRNEIAKLYRKNLSGCSEIKFIEVPENSVCSYYVFPIFVENRDSLKQRLLENEIETGIHYNLCQHQQPAFQNSLKMNGNFPNAERQFREELSLPMFWGITEDEVIKCCDLIFDLVQEF